MKTWIRVLAHIVFILSLSAITLVILNVYNPLMGFTASDYSKALFLALYVLAALLAVLVFTGADTKEKERDQKLSREDTEQR